MTLENIDKTLAAQRQIDAAIRILFSGEDILAVHTVASAALGILKDLAKKRGISLVGDQSIENSYKNNPPHIKESVDLQQFKKLIYSYLNNPANFLKHADRDAKSSLSIEARDTDNTLFECCNTYEELGLEGTAEMCAFATWYFAVYFHEDGHEIRTSVGYVHDLPRDVQIKIGDFLLTQYE